MIACTESPVKVVVERWRGSIFEEKPYSKQMLERRKEHVTMVIRRLLVPEVMMDRIK
jgi:hypothetical protein